VTQTSFLWKNTLGGWESHRIYSGGSCVVYLETIYVLVPSSNHQDKNWKDFDINVKNSIDILNISQEIL